MVDVVGRLTGRVTRVVEIPGAEQQRLAGRVRFWVRVSVTDGLRSDSGAVGLTVLFDFGAVRAVLDGLLAKLAGFRSDGELLDTDRAALEYVVLELVDEIVQRGEFASTVSILAFGVGEVPPPAPQCAHCCARLSVGPLGGELMAFIEHGGPGSLPSLPLSICVSDGERRALPSSIQVTLRAPFVSIPRDEWDGVAPGDLILAGVRSFEGVGRGLRLATPAGWTLCAARVVRHDPSEIEVDALDPCVEPDDPPLRADGREPDSLGVAHIRPLIASARLSPMEFEQLLDGGARPLRVALDGGSGETVRLCERDRIVAMAELVRYGDGLLAYRIVRFLDGARPVGVEAGQGGD